MVSTGAHPVDDPLEAYKRAAAHAALSEIADGMVIGLGSGSTAEIMLEELAGRVRQGLRVTGVASSERTRALAASAGIPLLRLDDASHLDLSLDGADEVAVPSLALIKGRGGALLREKLVAAASHRRIVMVDDSKLVDALGTRHALPVEVVPFGWVHTAHRLAAIGLRPKRRTAEGRVNPDGSPLPYTTDGGHYILDCLTDPINDPAFMARAIKALLGVVDHGLFVDMTDRVIAAGAGGVRTIDAHR